MRLISRPAFLDLAWGPADLDAAAEFWFRLFEVADRTQKFGGERFHTTDPEGGFAARHRPSHWPASP